MNNPSQFLGLDCGAREQIRTGCKKVPSGLDKLGPVASRRSHCGGQLLRTDAIVAHGRISVQPDRDAHYAGNSLQRLFDVSDAMRAGYSFDFEFGEFVHNQI